MAANGGGGGKLLALLILGALVAGGFNYHRNWKAEQQDPRPYAGTSDADLATLIDAYRGEVEAWRRREAALRDEPVATRQGRRFDERVREFEAAQRVGTRKREAAAALADREAALAELEEEERLRSGAGGLLGIHAKRLLTL